MPNFCRPINARVGTHDSCHGHDAHRHTKRRQIPGSPQRNLRAATPTQQSHRFFVAGHIAVPEQRRLTPDTPRRQPWLQVAKSALATIAAYEEDNLAARALEIETKVKAALEPLVGEVGEMVITVPMPSMPVGFGATTNG